MLPLLLLLLPPLLPLPPPPLELLVSNAGMWVLLAALACVLLGSSAGMLAASWSPRHL